MERYTKRLDDGQAVMECQSCKEKHINDQDMYCSALYCRNRLKDRLAEIEDILGDDYDLDRLRKLVEADRDGRCVVLPISTPSMAYTVDQKGGYISSGFYVTPGAVLHDTERGYIIAKTREAAEAALKGEQHEKH